MSTLELMANKIGKTDSKTISALSMLTLMPIIFGLIGGALIINRIRMDDMLLLLFGLITALLTFIESSILRKFLNDSGLAFYFGLFVFYSTRKKSFFDTIWKHGLHDHNIPDKPETKELNKQTVIKNCYEKSKQPNRDIFTFLYIIIKSIKYSFFVSFALYAILIFQIQITDVAGKCTNNLDNQLIQTTVCQILSNELHMPIMLMLATIFFIFNFLIEEYYCISELKGYQSAIHEIQTNEETYIGFNMKEKGSFVELITTETDENSELPSTLRWHLCTILIPKDKIMCIRNHHIFEQKKWNEF